MGTTVAVTLTMDLSLSLTNPMLARTPGLEATKSHLVTNPLDFCTQELMDANGLTKTASKKPTHSQSPFWKVSLVMPTRARVHAATRVKTMGKMQSVAVRLDSNWGQTGKLAPNRIRVT